MREKINGIAADQYYKTYNKIYYDKIGREKYLKNITKLNEHKCEKCNYVTIFKSNFSVHLKTKKHLR